MCYDLGRNMAEAKYTFIRKTDHPSGFLSANRPSTDAVSALSHWSGESDGRSYEEIADDDMALIARLYWHEQDVRAGTDLNALCDQFGVRRVASAD